MNGNAMEWKKFLFAIWKILRVFFKILSAVDKYSLLNRYNSTREIQMESSRKQKTFSQFLSTFLKPNLNFEDFQKSDDSHS